MAQKCSEGNNEPLSQKKTRWWVVTNYDFSVDWQKLIDQKKLRYARVGEETCPTTGRKHQQCWVYFNAARASRHGVGKLGATETQKGFGYCAPMYGTMENNEDYCQKEGDAKEWGNKPSQGQRTDMEEDVEAIKSGELTVDEIALEDPIKYHQYGRTFHKVEDLVLRKKYRTWMTKGIWYTGETGAGKSHQVFEDFNPDKCYVKPLEDEWWDGYTGQEIVILNEFRGQIKFSQLLDLVDKWPCYVKRRGREPVPFLAREVRISSILRPEDCYRNACDSRDTLAQLERRFSIIELKKGQGLIKTHN